MTGPLSSSAAIPGALANDPDDVVWALQTAAVQWDRGSFADAITWIRRAADSAIEREAWGRGSELNSFASQLSRMLDRQAEDVASKARIGIDAVDELLSIPAPAPVIVEMRGPRSPQASIDIEVQEIDADEIDAELLDEALLEEQLLADEPPDDEADAEPPWLVDPLLGTPQFGSEPPPTSRRPEKAADKGFFGSPVALRSSVPGQSNPSAATWSGHWQPPALPQSVSFPPPRTPFLQHPSVPPQRPSQQPVLAPFSERPSSQPPRVAMSEPARTLPSRNLFGTAPDLETHYDDLDGAEASALELDEADSIPDDDLGVADSIPDDDLGVAEIDLIDIDDDNLGLVDMDPVPLSLSAPPLALSTAPLPLSVLPEAISRSSLPLRRATADYLDEDERAEASESVSKPSLAPKSTAPSQPSGSRPTSRAPSQPSGSRPKSTAPSQPSGSRPTSSTRSPSFEPPADTWREPLGEELDDGSRSADDGSAEGMSAADLLRSEPRLDSLPPSLPREPSPVSERLERALLSHQLAAERSSSRPPGVQPLGTSARAARRSGPPSAPPPSSARFPNSEFAEAPAPLSSSAAAAHSVDVSGAATVVEWPAPKANEAASGQKRRPISSVPLVEDPPSRPVLLGVSLQEVEGLEDLPEEAQLRLVQRARIERLNKDESVPAFAVALVLKGCIEVMPSVVDVAASQIRRGGVVFTRGSLSEPLALRFMAGEDGTTLALWDETGFDEATHDCPWVVDELRGVADRLQGRAGVCIGEFGTRLDPGLRKMVFDKFEVRSILPGEALCQRGERLKGMFVVGAGGVEIVLGEGAESRVRRVLGPGEVLFARQILGAGNAPALARAAASGALVLHAERAVAHELMVSVPPLLEILAG